MDMDSLYSACQHMINDFSGPGENRRRSSFHETLEDIQRAKEGGCVLCATLWQSFADDMTPSIKPDSGWPRIITTVDTELEGYMKPGDFYSIFELPISTGFSRKWFYFEYLQASEKTHIVEKMKSLQSRNTGSDESLEQANKWISSCINGHKACVGSQVSERTLPTRLLHVGKNRVRLVETAPLPQATLYMTLSHCWGKSPMLTLKKDNFETFGLEIVFDTLPKTFQEAIHVVRVLGISYIWIDSLCIIQDSREDWLKESARMESVYSYSYCTIAATKSLDSRGGCFARKPSFNLPFILDVPSTKAPDIKRSYLVHWKDSWEDEVSKSPLLQRAWVFQERQLSPRILHFAKSQILFECRQSCASDIYPNGYNAWVPGVHKSWFNSLSEWSGQENGLLAWFSLIEFYNVCALSFEDDRLIAIAGLARRLKSTMNCRYLAGLWEYKLVEQLRWTWHPSKMYISYSAPLQKPPSWSWVSNPGTIEIQYDDSPPNFDIEVKDVHIATMDGNNEFSPVLSSSLCVTGRLIPTQVKKHESRWEGYVPPTGKDIFFRGSRYLLSYDFGITEIKGKLFSTLCSYWPQRGISERNGNGLNDRERIIRVEGLLLQRTGAERGRYRRVGRFSSYGKVHPEFSVSHPEILLKGDGVEKAGMTEDLYEAYDEATDKYTFSIV